jgi:hypothetical protein
MVAWIRSVFGLGLIWDRMRVHCFLVLGELIGGQFAILN